MKTTILTLLFFGIASLGFAQSGTEILTENFDAATSLEEWNTAGDAASRPGDVTFEWAETAGVSSSGAMRFGGVNSDPSVGRAYIIEKIFSGVDFAGETNVTVSVSIKSEGLASSNLAILTEINGSIQENPAATGDINESDFTTLTFTHPSIPADANFVKFSFNIAAGAVADAGGTILVDDISVTTNGGSTGGEELLVNGDFEDGRAPWTDTAGEIRTEGGNSFFFADITAAGNAFDVNLSQVLEIIQGETYTLTFDASTSAGNTRTMVAGIGLNEPPFTPATETVTLTDQSQTFTLELTATGFGSANSRVLFDMGAETGIVVIDNVSLVLGGSGGTGEVPEPAVAAPTPPDRAPEDVISLFSNAYTNINVTDWSTVWSEGTTNTDIVVEGDDVKRFDIVNFNGIQLESSIDLTEFTHMHIDYWVADEITGGEVFNPKLSNHGNLPDTEGETSAVEFTNPVTTSQDWVSLDVALDDFTVAGGASAARDKIFQIVLGAAGTLDVVYIDNFYFYKETATSIDDLETLPEEFVLDQNYPNPFNPSTNITYNLPVGGEVTLDVFNIQGQRVATLVSGFKNAGSHLVRFDATNLASGVYTYRLVTGSSVQVRKMLLIK